MPTAQITVLYVNPPKPGKRKGTIKTDTLGLVGCWPNQLLWFQRGQVYTIEYEDDGQYKNVKRVVPLETVANAAAIGNYANGHGPSPQASRAETRRYPQGGQQNKPDSKAIFLTGVVQQAMGSGQFKATDIVALTVNASTAWDQAMQQSSPHDDVPPPRSDADYGRDEGEPPF